MLKKFYVVTESRSLYEIYHVDESPPIIKKISKRGDSKLTIGSVLSGGTHVNVGTFGWVGLYDPFYRTGLPLSADMTSITLHGGHTSKVVGLFLNKRFAQKCLTSGDTEKLSPRWINFSRATLTKIGWKHPVFKIGTDFSHLILK